MPRQHRPPHHTRPADATALGGGVPIEELTPAEGLVLDQLRTGQTTNQIAKALCVSEATVRTHLTHIYAKLGVRGRVELLAGLAVPRGPDPPGLLGPTADSGPGPSEDGLPIEGLAQSPGPSPTSGRALLGRASLSAVGMLSAAAVLAHLAPLAATFAGPGLLVGQALIPRGRDHSAVRLGALAAGILLTTEQLAVLVALRAI